MFIKRVLDLLIASLMLLLLFPIIVIISIAILVDSGRPIIFIQDRVGRNGRNFPCIKFRTMSVGTEFSGLGIMVSKDDSRITRVGRFLRQWSLDEIPQLINVLKGDMSIIGPRPVLPFQTENYTDEERRRLEMRPGMAGYAWIHGRRSLPWPERIKLDIWYIDNWSLRLDAEILFKAFLAVLKQEGMNVTPPERINSASE